MVSCWSALLDVGSSPAVAVEGYVEIDCGVLFQRDKVEKRIKGEEKHCFQFDLTLRATHASGEQVYLKTHAPATTGFRVCRVHGDPTRRDAATRGDRGGNAKDGH